MSQETKHAQREKERLIKNVKRCTETQEECDEHRKTNCDSMMGKRQTETDKQGAKHKKTMQECVSKQRQTETEEQAAKCKKIKRDYTSRKRLTETNKQAAKCKKTMRECVSKQRQTETEEQTDERKKTNRDNMRRKQEEMRHQFLNDSRDCNGEDMTNVIDRATKEAKQSLHRTQNPANPHKHRAIVCIICDCFIIGSETIHKLTKEDIGAHSGRLGVKSYEEYYQTTLKVEVKKQYQVQGLQDMLLSP
jgi:hypothetical protein